MSRKGGRGGGEGDYAVVEGLNRKRPWLDFLSGFGKIARASGFWDTESAITTRLKYRLGLSSTNWYVRLRKSQREFGQV